MIRKLSVYAVLLGLVLYLCIGCSIKGGTYNVSDSPTKELIDNGSYVAFEADLKHFQENRLNLSLGFGALVNAAHSGELQTTHGTVSQNSLKFYDIYTTLSYHPLGMKKSDSPGFFKPYVGAGFGYYNMRSEFRSKGEYVGSDAFYNYYELNEESHTIAKGFNPHVVAGISIPLGENWCIFVDDRYEINRVDGKIDMSGNLIMFGLKFGLR